jgi:hypothetical protein
MNRAPGGPPSTSRWLASVRTRRRMRRKPIPWLEAARARRAALRSAWQRTGLAGFWFTCTWSTEATSWRPFLMRRLISRTSRFGYASGGPQHMSLLLVDRSSLYLLPVGVSGLGRVYFCRGAETPSLVAGLDPFGSPALSASAHSTEHFPFNARPESYLQQTSGSVPSRLLAGNLPGPFTCLNDLATPSFISVSWAPD